MPAAGKLGQQANNAGVQRRAQDSCLQAWQALGAVAEVTPAVSPRGQPPSVPFPAPPRGPSSRFPPQLGSLLTKYSENKSTRGGPKWKAKNNRAVENTVMPELHSRYLVRLLLEKAAAEQHDARRFLVVKQRKYGLTPSF